MAALAADEALHRAAAVPGHCRAVAYPGGGAQSRPRQSGGQRSLARPCARISLLLLHQRAFPALPRQTLSARLQQAIGPRFLAGTTRVALSLEPVSPCRPGAGMAQPPHLLLRPALRRNEHDSVS